MKVTSVICLGDAIGYGPDPCACVEIAMGWEHVLKGNMEEAMLQPDRYPDRSRDMVRRLQRDERRIRQHRMGLAMIKFLSGRPTSYLIDGALFVHASPRDHVREHIFPERIYDSAWMSAVFATFENLCFCGHTHIPGIFKENPRNGNNWVHVAPTDDDNEFKVGQQKLLCNVGSVGQPRDEDPRACYVLFDGSTIVFRRVEYDVQKTRDKINRIENDDEEGDGIGVPA